MRAFALCHAPAAKSAADNQSRPARSAIQVDAVIVSRLNLAGPRRPVEQVPAAPPIGERRRFLPRGYHERPRLFGPPIIPRKIIKSVDCPDDLASGIRGAAVVARYPP
jgi:hypothetical protein